MVISQDRLGRIWLGTREGINIYDGASITTYKGWFTDPVTGEKIWIGNEVHSIQPDSAGNIFIHIDDDIVKYDIAADRFSRFTSRSDVKALTESEGKIIYIAADSIMVKDATTDSLHFHFVVPALGNIPHLAADKLNYYISTKNGLHQFDRKSRRHSVMLPGTPIHSVFTGRDGTVWICTDNGGLYRKGTHDTSPVLVSMPTAPKGVLGALQSRFATEDKSGRIWYGSFTGLFCYDPETGTTRHIQIPANIGGLTHSSVFGMYCDRLGNIWAGTYYGGVNYFSPAREQFINFNYETLAPEGLYHSFIIDMVKDRNGDLWFGTDGAGVCCVDSDWNIKKTLSTRNGTNALRQNNIKALEYDPVGHRLYIGTHLGGLSVYDIARGSTTNLIDRTGEKGIPGNVIHSLKVRGNTLFIASRTGLSWMDMSTGRITPIPVPIYPLRIDYDDEGSIYYITQTTNNVYKITDPTGQNPTTEKIGEIDKTGIPTNICCTSDGLYVTSLGDGISYFPGYRKELRHITSADSDLPDDYCYNIEQADNGSLYILTSKHIVKMDPEGANIESINFSDFFPEAHIIDECALLPLSSGDILVGSTKGITHLSDDNFGNPASTGERPVLFFSKLKVHNRDISPADGSGILSEALPYASVIRLPHNRTNFSIRLGMSDYTTSTGSPLIEYRLEGSNNRHWVLAEDGEIRYNTLPPGHYTLHARQAGSPDEISIVIDVDRPWYSTWWAWTLYILIASAICYFIVKKSIDAAQLRLSLRKEKLERNQIEQLNKEKLVFFTNVSHEFQTPLTLIMSHVDLLMARYKRNETLVSTLGRIRYQSQQMSHLITQLLEFRKLQQNHQILRLGYYDGRESLLQTATPFIDYAARRSIDFTIDTPDKAVTGFYDPALIDRVLVNILSNAFKYTPDGGSISCSVSQGSDSTIVFRISDTGKGISEKDLPFIFDRFYNGNSDEMKRYNMDYRSTGIGLAFAKSIIDKHHGTIDVTSREGEGTTFIVSVPASPEPYSGDMNTVVEQTPTVSPVGQRSEFDTGMDERVHSAPDTAPAPAGDDDDDTADSSPGESTLPLMLIVEDNAELRHNLTSFFSQYFRIAEAEDGIDGLEKARSENPDIIISDVMMPRMSGTEMCRSIKSDINICHIPVILLTALSASESQLEGLNANADDYITKPFESTILLARVDNLLRNRRMLMGQFDKQPVSAIDLSVVNPIDRDLLKRTSEIIDAHMDDADLDIAFICKELGISRSLFFTKFKSLTGMTPSAFIVNYRLKYAATLLSAQPHLSVADIAYQTGFSNPAYFGRCFRKQFGVSPQQYRKGESVVDNSDSNLP